MSYVAEQLRRAFEECCRTVLGRANYWPGVAIPPPVAQTFTTDNGWQTIPRVWLTADVFSCFLAGGVTHIGIQVGETRTADFALAQFTRELVTYRVGSDGAVYLRSEDRQG